MDSYGSMGERMEDEGGPLKWRYRHLLFNLENHRTVATNYIEPPTKNLGIYLINTSHQLFSVIKFLIFSRPFESLKALFMMIRYNN